MNILRFLTVFSISLLVFACQKQSISVLDASVFPDQLKERGITIPDMDIILAYNGQQQSCSGSAQPVSSSTANGVTTFNWSPNASYLINIHSGNNTETIRLLTENAVGNNPATARYYKLAHYACLTNPSTSESSDHKTLTIAVDGNNVTLRGNDSDNSSEKSISITHPAGYSVMVAQY